MDSLAPLTLGRFLGTWRFDPWATAVIVGLLLGYAVGLRNARRQGHSWPLRRAAGFVVLGLGTLVVASMSSLMPVGPQMKT